MPPKSTWNSIATQTPATTAETTVYYEQPPTVNDHIEREVYNLPPHPLSNPRLIAKALHMKSGLRMSDKVRSKNGFVMYRDKQKDTDFGFRPLGSVVLFQDVEDGNNVLYINETPSTVLAAHAIYNVLTDSDSSLLDTSIQNAVTRRSRLRTAGRALFAETTLLPLELTPFLWGSSPIELFTAALGGTVIGLLGLASNLAYTSRLFPKTFERMVAAMPKYLKSGSVVKAVGSVEYNIEIPEIIDLLKPDPIWGYISPAELVGGILTTSTNPTQTWGSIREDTYALFAAQRRADSARVVVQTKQKLDSDTHPAEQETSEGASKEVKYIMNAIAQTVQPSLSEQAYQTRKNGVIEAAMGLLKTAGAAKTLASYFSELLVRTACNLEAGDMEGMDQLEAMYAYIDANLPLVQDVEMVKTALTHLRRVYGDIIELPPRHEMSL